MKTITRQEHELITAVIGEGLTTLAEAILEKDLLVTDVLHIIAHFDSGGIGLVFCGGTCLFKAHNLIERISEDVDFKLIVPDGLSRSGRKRTLSQFKKRMISVFEQAGYSVPLDQVVARDENSYICMSLQYESQFAPVASLRTEIKVEFSARAPELPTVPLPVSSMLARLIQHPPDTLWHISCISVEETLAEKVLSFLRRTAEAMAGRNRGAYDDRLVRHLYDVTLIGQNHQDFEQARKHFLKLVMGDAIQFRNQFPEFEQDPQGQMQLALNALHQQPVSFERDYVRFVDELIFGQQVSFDQARSEFCRLAHVLLR